MAIRSGVADLPFGRNMLRLAHGKECSVWSTGQREHQINSELGIIFCSESGFIRRIALEEADLRSATCGKALEPRSGGERPNKET